MIALLVRLGSQTMLVITDIILALFHREVIRHIFVAIVRTVQKLLISVEELSSEILSLFSGPHCDCF